MDYIYWKDLWLVFDFCFKDTATTEIYTYLHTVPYTTLFRSRCADRRRRAWRCAGRDRAAPERLFGQHRDRRRRARIALRAPAAFQGLSRGRQAVRATVDPAARLLGRTRGDDADRAPRHCRR